MFFIVSCNNEGSNSRPASGASGFKDNSFPPPNMNQGGTGSTGGGNGIDGKPLESYIDRELKSKKYFIDFVQPLFINLAKEFPRLAADFYHLLNERDWYFVPSKLESVSKNILGAYGITDQYALQDLNKIWINSIEFNKMTDRDQATLIIHEIIMGIGLLKYKTHQDQCIAKAAVVLFSEDKASENDFDMMGISEKKLTEYNKAKEHCREVYAYINGIQNEKFVLDSNDYDFIRKIVSLLVAEKIDFKEIKSLIKSNQFREYSD